MSRLKIPYGLFISAIVCLVLGLIAGPLIRSSATEEQLNQNVLLSAIPFILIFVSILLVFIAFIAILASVLNDHIDARVYKIIESIIIAGIVLGVIGMFQPWHMLIYKNGFRVLLISTLSFIVWSHIRPGSEQRQEELS